MSNTALLFSGGLDSFLAHRYLKDMGTGHNLVFVDCGTTTNDFEKERMVDMCVDLHLPIIQSQNGMDLSLVEYDTGFVPLRNLLFLAIPVMNSYNTVYLAAVRGEGSLDKSHRFFKDTSNLFSYMLGQDIRVSSPIDQFTKTELVAMMLRNNLVTANELRQTTSCYRPQHTKTDRCGTCNACVRRWVAMTNNDIWEPYDINPLFEALNLVKRTPVTKLFEQPLGRWPDVIMTNKELRDAINRVHGGVTP